jgi:hypothetical protein
MKKAVLVLSALVSFVALPIARADILPPHDGGYPWLPPDIGYDLPNHRGGYVSPAQYHALYDNVLRLDKVFHYGFFTSYAPPAPGITDTHSFGALMELTGVFNYLGTWYPFTLTDVPNTTTVSITGLSSPGDFSTEMLALNLSTPTPVGVIMLRESPTLASTGHTTFTSVSGGYQIDSFFDVYTEISLDSGATWIPSDGFVRVEYVCPEPASTALALLGFGLVAMCRRSRKT